MLLSFFWVFNDIVFLQFLSLNVKIYIFYIIIENFLMENLENLEKSENF